MKTIALVSVTLNAVNPMTNYLKQFAGDITVVNYLDSYLLDKVNQEGRITDESMGRMFEMLTKACVDGADGIILTCTIFSPYVELFSSLLSVPIICPDGAMLDEVSKNTGKKAILCTFEGTVKITRDMYYSYCDKNGTSRDVDMIVVPGAYEAASRGDMNECSRLIRQRVEELDPEYDQLVLAQISMAGAIEGFTAVHACIHTSPASAYRTIMDKISHTS